MMDESNPYLPYIVNIEDAWYETPGDRAIKTFKVNFADPKVWDTWSHEPGNCAMVGRLGIGESMFCISSSKFTLNVLTALSPTGVSYQVSSILTVYGR